MTIDLASGVYLRSEGDRLLFGGPPSPRSARYSTQVDWPWMGEVLRLGVPRFPWLAELPMDWAALVGWHLRDVPGQPGHLRPAPGRPGRL